MPQPRFFQDPTWEEVLNDQATVEDYIQTVFESIWDSFGPINIRLHANEIIRKQYILDKKQMLEEGIPASEFPDPLFR